MDFKAELIKLQQYCIENRNYLKASESSSDRTAADAYQDVRNNITDVFEREKNELNTSEPHLPLADVSGRSELLFCHHNGSYTTTKDEDGIEWCCKCRCQVAK